jgi:4'-phosphopantetheinyl transferase
MTALGWLLLPQQAVPDDDDWLSPLEREVLSRLRFEARRRDWRLGRWAAREALRRGPEAWLDGTPLARIAIVSDADGAPHVVRPRGPEPCAISLSHRDGRALVAIAGPDARVGCDLERIEPRSDAFLRDYFTAAEGRLLEERGAGERDRSANLIWCAKESAVKVLGTGWRVDTRSVEVQQIGEPGPGWRPLRVRRDGLDPPLEGWWRQEGELLASVLASPPPDPPRRLAAPATGRPAPPEPARPPLR